MGAPATSSLRVIVCDDDDLIRIALEEHLSAQAYQVVTASNGQQCLDAALTQAPDAILLDIHMPVMDGLTCLQKMREASIRVPVIVMTASEGVENAIEATRLGAAAYIAKPFDLREVSLKLAKALESERLAQEVGYLRDRQRARYANMIGQTPAMVRVFDLLSRLEGVDAPTVLVLGESGTGKELVAQAIHARGPRANAPFVEIDCASLPETLIEAELFGYERGAFTDARQQKRGLFEVARGGTIFLDEIGEMPIGTQAKLLRVLESRRMRRLGGITDIAVDVGVVAATNRDLLKEIEGGRFRKDLYYRLAVIPVELPALRLRSADIPALVAHMLAEFGRRIPGRLAGITAPALDALVRYSWPGNVRELRNVLERIATLYRDDPLVDLMHLPPEVRFTPRQEAPSATGKRFVLPPDGVDLEAVEYDFVVQALERTDGNQTAAAKLLGISRFALRNRVEKFGLKGE